VWKAKGPPLGAALSIIVAQEPCYSFFLSKSITIGVAIAIEEYVPNTIPTSNAKVNPLITSPPKINNTSVTIKTVNEVMMVRFNVLFNASLITFFLLFSW
jgi:hypothetical protein